MPEIEVGPFVNAAGLPAQLALDWVAALVETLVTPLIMKSQTCVPDAIPALVTVMVEGCVNATVPAQPGASVTVGAAVRRKPAGKVSVNAIPV